SSQIGAPPKASLDTGFDSPHPLSFCGLTFLVGFRCSLFLESKRRTPNVELQTSNHLPPKSLRNDLNTRPGKVAAFSGKPGTCCANGYCSPPCTWHAAVGTLSAGKSMS